MVNFLCINQRSTDMFQRRDTLTLRWLKSTNMVAHPSQGCIPDDFRFSSLEEIWFGRPDASLATAMTRLDSLRALMVSVTCAAGLMAQNSAPAWRTFPSAPQRYDVAPQGQGGGSPDAPRALNITTRRHHLRACFRPCPPLLRYSPAQSLQSM